MSGSLKIADTVYVHSFLFWEGIALVTEKVEFPNGDWAAVAMLRK
jgi:hypothetical protein